MAKITIILEDKDDGNATLSVNFDPPLSCTSEAEVTDAQLMGVMMLQAAKAISETWETDDE